jgi:hypothetical protein
MKYCMGSKRERQVAQTHQEMDGKAGHMDDKAGDGVAMVVSLHLPPSPFDVRELSGRNIHPNRPESVCIPTPLPIAREGTSH